jgi:hypothetical protein
VRVPRRTQAKLITVLNVAPRFVRLRSTRIAYSAGEPQWACRKFDSIWAAERIEIFSCAEFYVRFRPAGAGGVITMHSYEIDLRETDGMRVCLLSVAFAKDGSAISLARSIVKSNSKRGARVVVWREDEVIFELPALQLH